MNQRNTVVVMVATYEPCTNISPEVSYDPICQRPGCMVLAFAFVRHYREGSERHSCTHGPSHPSSFILITARCLRPESSPPPPWQTPTKAEVRIHSRTLHIYVAGSRQVHVERDCCVVSRGAFSNHETSSSRHSASKTVSL